MGEHGIGTSSSTQHSAGYAAAAEEEARADVPTESNPVLPKPRGGSGSHELATDSSDPAVLRRHLERARERLLFYESFDRIIGENIRRSGELMLETITLREDAQERDRAVAQLEMERNAARAAEHHRSQALLGDLLEESDRALAGIATLRARLSDALAAGESDRANPAPVAQASNVAVPIDLLQAPEPTVTERVAEFTPDVPAPSALAVSADPIAATDTVDSGEIEIPAPVAAAVDTLQTTPLEAGTHDGAPSAEVEGINDASTSGDPAHGDTTAETPSLDDVSGTATGPTTTPAVDLLVHGVPRATIAISLQRYLKNLPAVTSVETREFAEGVLRLTVITTNSAGLALSDLADWPDGGNLTVLNEQDTVLELSLSDSVELEM